MRIEYNQRSRSPKWLKWFLSSVLLVIIICFVYGIFLYYNIQKDKTAGFSETKEMILQDTELVNIQNIERYHGESSYHVVFGETEESEKKIVFVPLEKDKENKEDLIIIDQTEITSKEAMQSQWQKQCDNCELVKITPGIENNEPLWEITYIDNSKRYVLEYLSIYDGTQQEQFRFTRMFK